MRARLFRKAILFFVLSAAGPAASQTDDPFVFCPARYYPGSPDSAGATPISLAPGETSAPLVMMLDPAGGAVALRVLSAEDSSPVEGILVEALRGRFVPIARTGPDGRAIITGAPAGTFVVRTRPDDPRSAEGAFAVRYAPGVVDRRDAAVFDLLEGDTIDIGVIAVPAAARVKVRCLRPDGGPWPGVPAILRSAGGGLRRAAPTGADGRAHFGGLEPGGYQLWIDASGTDSITECSDGSRDTLAAPVIGLARGQLFSGIEISPDLGGAISGAVRNRDSGLGLPDLEVSAVSQDRPGTVFSGRSNPFGFYTIRGLPAGTYKVHVPAIRRWFPDAASEAEARGVSVTEPDETSRIDIQGRPDPECGLPPSQAGFVQGSVIADFALMPRAVIELRGEADTLRQTITEAGTYHFGCIPAGQYRAAFLPDGSYRRQYHPKTNAPDSAVAFTVALADTVFAVDFEPERSVVLQGSILAPPAGLGIEGIPVLARRAVDGTIARSTTDATGAWRIDRLSDGTGLPEGAWIVGTDSVSLGEIDVTAVESISILARRLGSEIAIEFRLGALEPIDWQLEREDGAGDRQVWIDARSHPDGTRARRADDPDPPADPRYRLTIWIASRLGPRAIRTEWIGVARSEEPQETIHPVPWDGRSPLILPDPAGANGRVELITPAGSRIAILVSRDGRLDPIPGSLPSGIYFLRWRDAAGAVRTGRLVLRR